MRQTVRAVRDWLGDEMKDRAIMTVIATIVVVLITVVGWGAMMATRTLLGWIILSSLTNAAIVTLGIGTVLRLYWLKDNPLMQGRPKSHFVRAGAIHVIPRILDVVFIVPGIFFAVWLLLRFLGW